MDYEDFKLKLFERLVIAAERIAVVLERDAPTEAQPLVQPVPTIPTLLPAHRLIALVLINDGAHAEASRFAEAIGSNYGPMITYYADGPFAVEYARLLKISRLEAIARVDEERGHLGSEVRGIVILSHENVHVPPPYILPGFNAVITMAWSMSEQRYPWTFASNGADVHGHWPP